VIVGLGVNDKTRAAVADALGDKAGVGEFDEHATSRAPRAQTPTRDIRASIHRRTFGVI